MIKNIMNYLIKAIFNYVNFSSFILGLSVYAGTWIIKDNFYLGLALGIITFIITKFLMVRRPFCYFFAILFGIVYGLYLGLALTVPVSFITKTETISIPVTIISYGAGIILMCIVSVKTVRRNCLIRDDKKIREKFHNDVPDLVPETENSSPS